jgi:hypothetical protein
VAAMSLASCKEDPKPQGSPPPPVASPASSSVDVCASGGGTLADASLAPFFPKVIGAYCVDPTADLKTYGDRGKLTMKQLCDTALDGGCEEYMKFGVTRAAIFHYVHGRAAGSVEVLVSQFPDDAAFAIYTTRLTGDLDPADPTMPRPMADLAAGALGAMGTGKAYVWRGPYFLELTYNNDQETPDQLTKSSAVALGSLAKEISSKLPDKPEMPAAGKALPTTDRLPVGVLYYTKDALGVAGLGAGAIGFHKAGDARWRTIAVVKSDADQAKDAMKTLSRKPGALPVSNLGDDAVQVSLQATAERPKVDTILARKGATILGVSDEELVQDKKLSKDDKVTRLRAILASH